MTRGYKLVLPSSQWTVERSLGVIAARAAVVNAEWAAS